MAKHSAPQGGFEWTCPYCGASRLNKSGGGEGGANAIVALRTHILASDDTEHGPVNEYPDGYGPAKLSHHVVRVDRRGQTTESEE